MRADSMPYGRIVKVCAVDDVACSGPVAVGLPCSSDNTGSHRRSGGRRWAVCTRRTPHISPTTCRPLCDDSPEPYPLPDRATCAGMPLSNHPGGELRSFGYINGNFGPRNSSCARRVPNKISRPPRDGIVGLCSPGAERPTCMGTGVDIRGRAGSDPSARGEPHPTGTSALEDKGLRSCRTYRVELEPVP